MSYNPSLHTSGLTLSLTDNSPLHTLDPRAALGPPLNPKPTVPSPHQQSLKKRRSSRDKAPTAIRRSSSTPHMRNLALTNSGELSPTADKRRNKLGYHRTSVACGHCRRRKIRCLIAQDDPSGRCANCIRLKKECNFYPVEQNPENQRSQASLVKESTAGAPSSSTTSSPRQPPSAPGEKAEDFRAPFPESTSTSRYGIQPDVDADPHHIPQSSGMQMHHPPYAYPPSIETQWPTPGFLPSSSVAETSPSSSGYWRPSPSTTTSAYGSESNVSGSQTPATMSSASNMSYRGHGEPHSWGQPNIPPPTRSMSYGNIEGLHQQYSNTGIGIPQHDFPRRTSPYPYPSTIDTNHTTMHTTTLGSATAAPLSAPILPNQQYSYHQTWNPYGGVHGLPHEVPTQGRSMSGQWYNESGQLDQVQEEGGPPTTYSHQGLPSFYSGP